MKPSEERTSGNLERRTEIHLGVVRRVARREEDNRGEEVNVMEGEPREELLKTLWLACPGQDFDGVVHFAQRIRSETGANWKGHSKLQVL